MFSFHSRHLTRSTWRRGLLVLAALILALQVIGTVLHKHDVTTVAPDCVSCYMAAHQPTNPPAANVTLQAIALVLAYRLARLPHYWAATKQSCLTPPSQAPPRRLHTA